MEDTTKHDHIICDECKESFHADHPWREDVDGNSVCEGCAEDRPVLFVSDVCGNIYGHCEFTNEEVSTGFFKTKEEATERAKEMSLNQWGVVPVWEVEG